MPGEIDELLKLPPKSVSIKLFTAQLCIILLQYAQCIDFSSDASLAQVKILIT
jgi:hypothetical protein